MRIGIDIGPAVRRRTGVGAYCHHLVKHLHALNTGDVLVGFSSGAQAGVLAPDAPHIPRRHVHVPTRVLYAAWTLWRRPRVDKLLKGVDVFHATNYFLPPTARAARVVTIHDLAFLLRPELCSPKVVGPFSRGVARFVRDANAVLVYSESTRNDLIRLLGAPPEKITVAPLGVDDQFLPVDRDAAQARVREALHLTCPYILFVGTIEPRKNIETLLAAYAALAGSLEHRLVVAGAQGWKADRIPHLIRRYRIEDRVVFPGYVPQDVLPALYSAAELLVLPSHYEGFGLPLLEAMACGCPVVAADNSSMPEVVGDAGLLAPAEDASALAESIMRVLEDAPLRERMVRSGRKRAGNYTWRACAEATLGVYRRVADARAS